jgi:integrase
VCVAAGDLAPRTLEGYEYSLRCHVLPAFAGRRVRSITPDQLVAWIRRLRAQGYAQHTVHNHWGAANLVLGYAVRHGALAANPGDRLTSCERPKAGSGSRRALDSVEIERLLAAAPERYRVSIACGVFSGLRVAELLGLAWGEIDLRGSVIRVRHQMSRQGERRRLKTAAATRDVVLMSGLGRELRLMRLASPFSSDEDLVFCATSGKTIGHRNIASRGLEQAAARAGLSGVTFHVLRHTFASILIAEGHDPVFVSRQLGHASPAITLHVYAHLFDAARHARQARDRLDARYGRLLSPKEAVVQHTLPLFPQ